MKRRASRRAQWEVINRRPAADRDAHEYHMEWHALLNDQLDDMERRHRGSLEPWEESVMAARREILDERLRLDAFMRGSR
jgi:hypothetical protein